jgi:hypothetical protein
MASPSPALASSSQPQSAALAAYTKGIAFQSKWNAYYSRIHINAVSGTGATGFTVLAGPELKGFGYYNGQDMAAAGQAGTIATYADTNIQTASTTVASEAIEIDGIGLILLGQSDANLAKQLDQCLSVTLRMNGNTNYPMGIPSMLPGPGGLYGASEAASVVPDQLSQIAIQIGAMSNGIPHISNYYPLPEPMVWASAGAPDSTLNVIVKVERTCTTNPNFGAVARTAVAGGADTPGTAAYTPPLFGAVGVDYMIVLVGRTVNKLSSN